MLVLVIIDTALLLAAVVYIVALLRSHADILRRLSLLEDGGGPARATAPEPVVGGGEVTAAAPISGITTGGDSVMLGFGDGSPATLLAFMTSGCTSCAPLWEGMRAAGGVRELAERVVIVTHDSNRESPARVARLAPQGAEVVMSSAAWEEYAVPASPHFVLTDGRGGIRGRGAALSWSQLLTMVQDAGDDNDFIVPPGAAGPDAPAAGSDPAGAAGAAAAARAVRVRTTAERTARSEQMLAEAGIGPGHPSLYPSGRPPAADPER